MSAAGDQRGLADTVLSRFPLCFVTSTLCSKGKINPEEILYRFAHQLDPKANNAGGSSSSGNDGEAGADPRCETYPKPGRAAATSAAHTPEHWATGHYAIINPFPLGRYSGLLAPFLQEFRNQRMRKDALIVGMAFGRWRCTKEPPLKHLLQPEYMNALACSLLRRSGF